MIRQHLCQYTQLRHETDMFNQSVSVLLFALCALPCPPAEQNCPSWPALTGFCQRMQGKCLQQCCAASLQSRALWSHFTQFFPEGDTTSWSTFGQHEPFLALPAWCTTPCLCREDAELLHCWKRECIYIFSLLKTGHLSNIEVWGMHADSVQLCLV